MTNLNDDWIIVGCFGKVHGIRGLIRVHSFTHPREAILDYLPWHVQFSKQRQLLKISQVKAQDKHILIGIEGIDTPEKAAAFTNLAIEIPRSTLPVLTEGEYYWHELIGLRVVNKAAEELGVVVDMMSTGSNDVLVVEGDKRHLIPYLLEQFIEKIDKDQRIITVDWDKDF